MERNIALIIGMPLIFLGALCGFAWIMVFTGFKLAEYIWELGE